MADDAVIWYFGLVVIICEIRLTTNSSSVSQTEGFLALWISAQILKGKKLFLAFFFSYV